jgi:hypothetical protein
MIKKAPGLLPERVGGWGKRGKKGRIPPIVVKVLLF